MEWLAKFTFEGLVAFGRASGATLHGDKKMPWSFNLFGRAVTHENDDRYIICMPKDNIDFRRGDVLVITEGEWYLSTPKKELNVTPEIESYYANLSKQ